MATHEGFVHVQDPSMPPAGASVTKGWIFVDEDGDTEPAGTRSGIQLRDESAGRDDPAPGGEAEPAEDQNAAPAEDLPPKDQDTATLDPNGQPTPSDEGVVRVGRGGRALRGGHGGLVVPPERGAGAGNAYVHGG